MLELTECFYSLQGEGPFSGQPTTFIRLSRCVPPYCPWCDSKFAWEAGRAISVEDMVEEVMGYTCRFVVITGGEPFLQWNNGLQQLEAALLQRGRRVQYETSGKVEIPAEVKGYTVCSPKFLEGRWQISEANVAAADAFKFVVETDFSAVDEFIDRWKIAPSKVWIMPLGTTREAQLTHMESIWRYCMERGYSFSPRLHTLTFNDQRGV